MNNAITFRQHVNSHFDFGKVARTELLAQTIEADTFTERNLLLESRIVGEHVNRPFVEGHFFDAADFGDLLARSTGQIQIGDVIGWRTDFDERLERGGGTERHFLMGDQVVVVGLDGRILLDDDERQEGTPHGAIGGDVANRPNSDESTTVNDGDRKLSRRVTAPTDCAYSGRNEKRPHKEATGAASMSRSRARGCESVLSRY